MKSTLLIVIHILLIDPEKSSDTVGQSRLGTFAWSIHPVRIASVYISDCPITIDQ